MFFYYHTTKDFFPDYKRKKIFLFCQSKVGLLFFPLLKEIHEEILKVFPVSNHGKRKQKKKKKIFMFYFGTSVATGLIIQTITLWVLRGEGISRSSSLTKWRGKEFCELQVAKKMASTSEPKGTLWGGAKSELALWINDDATETSNVIAKKNKGQ